MVTNPGFRRAAIFDVDDTLVRGQSGGMLVRYAYKRKILPLPSRLLTLLNVGRYRMGRLPEERIVALGALVWRGLHLDQLNAMASACFDEVVRPCLFPQGIDRVRTHIERGDLVILASGSVHFLVERIAEYVGAHVAIGTRSAYADGIAGRAIDGHLCYREGKVALVEAALEREGIALGQCSVYTDHDMDLPLLERAGERTVVNPTATLRERAHTEGWRIEDWGPRGS